MRQNDGNIDRAAKAGTAALGIVPLLDMRPCALVELDETRCRWPLGEVHEVATEFCGAGKVPALPYCAHHLRIAHGQGSAVTIGAILNRMSLSPDQRHVRLLADRTRDIGQITAAVTRRILDRANCSRS